MRIIIRNIYTILILFPFLSFGFDSADSNSNIDNITKTLEVLNGKAIDLKSNLDKLEHGIDIEIENSEDLIEPILSSVNELNDVFELLFKKKKFENKDQIKYILEAVDSFNETEFIEIMKNMDSAWSDLMIAQNLFGAVLEVELQNFVKLYNSSEFLKLESTSSNEINTRMADIKEIFDQMVEQNNLMMEKVDKFDQRRSKFTDPIRLFSKRLDTFYKDFYRQLIETIDLSTEEWQTTLKYKPKEQQNPIHDEF